MPVSENAMVEWAEFMKWAVRDSHIRNDFYIASGKQFKKTTDENASYNHDLTTTFCHWVTLAMWGYDGVPSDFMKDAKKAFPKEARTLEECRKINFVEMING